MYGFQPLTPVSTALSSSDLIPDKNVDLFLFDNVTWFEVICNALLDSQRRMASHYDHLRKDIAFEVGDLVYLNASDIRKPPGQVHKLLPCFCGPFKILKHPSLLNYHLDLPPQSHAHDVFHVKKLLLAYEHDWHLFPTSNDLVPDDNPVADDLGDYYDEEYEVKS